MQDEAVYVASRAIVAMSRLQEKALDDELMEVWKRAKGTPEKLSVLNDMVFLQDSFVNCHFEFEQGSEWELSPVQEIEWRVKYLSRGF